MQELLQAALHPYNILYTGLLGIVLIYWLTVIVGAMEMDAIDMNWDADADAGHIDTDHGWFVGALHFFHFDRLPFMVVMSLVVVAGWALSILTNHYWGAYTSTFALVMAGPILLAALIIAKVISYPLLPLFAATNTAVADVEYIGRVCRVKLPPEGDKFGQAGVAHSGDELLIHIKAARDGTALHVGQQARIVSLTDDQRYWLVEPLEHTES